MDEPIKAPILLDKELEGLLARAKPLTKKEAWFGRCIFLSFHCERGTCTFCFRSVAKDTKAIKAKRSLASILSEALLIKAFGWRIEFLTGGYGIVEDKELLRIIRLVHQILGEKLWVNLGEMDSQLLEELKPYVEGIVSSIETINPVLHKQVCPDKPIEPYEEMMDKARKIGFKLSFTIIIGLGETKEDFPLLESFIKKHEFERITIYALRPVNGTPFEKGPSPQDVIWWIAKTRIAFPDIEIIAGSAEYRKEEIPFLLDAGADAITKLPATKIFNKDAGKYIEQLIAKTKRNFTSSFSHQNVNEALDFEQEINDLDLTQEERTQLKRTLRSYLEMMNK